MIPKHYETLGVSRKADLEALKLAAKNKVAELKKAYAVLANPDSRGKYDQVLDEELSREQAMTTRRPVPRPAPEPRKGHLIRPSSRDMSVANGTPVMKPRRSVLIVVPLLCIALGFFMGREHLKYEIRSSIAQGMEEAGREFQRNMANLRDNLAGATAQTAPEPAPAPPPPQELPDFQVELLSKGFVPANLPSVPDSLITMKLRFRNPFNKEVRAFNGVVIFKDLLGEVIHRVRLTEDTPVGPRERWEWEGGIDYNRFMDTHQKLASMDRANMQVDFQVSKVLFSDGTTEEY